MLDYPSVRKYLIFAVLLVLIFQSLSVGMSLSQEKKINAERQKIDMIEKDVFAIYISPPVNNLSVRCEPLRRSGAFDLTMSTKYLDPYLRLRREVSAVWVQPNGPGIYNLTVNFSSNKSWEYLVGVFTRNFDFYREYYGKRISIQNFFMEIQPVLTRHPGNWTIIVTLEIHSLSPSFSYITLPTPVNFAILVAAVGLIAYVDSFIIIDTYFKSKKEIISYGRWIIVGVALLISAYLAYQMYNFTTFTLSGVE
ncbi:hypothetical protein CW705_08640 [Candidatus Bathyarchaeota archaeon]|nr:MAG: hypothetical protein CW705_08640 [Candidatus Bathyarchaeota archaeon]